MDEKEAVIRLKQGDPSGLEALVYAYQAKAVRVAYLITRDVSLAEDVVQGAFVKAWQRIAQFDDRRPFEAWFLRIVANDALKMVTRRQRELPLEQAESAGESLTSPAPTPAQLLDRAETREEMWEALGKLTPRLRTTVVLCYYLGVTEAEAADWLGCPRGTIRSRLHTARQRLRVLLRATRSIPDELSGGTLAGKPVPRDVRGGE